MIIEINRIYRENVSNLPYTLIDRCTIANKTFNSLRPYQNWTNKCLMLTDDTFENNFHHNDEKDPLTGVLDKSSKDYAMWLTEENSKRAKELKNLSIKVSTCSIEGSNFPYVGAKATVKSGEVVTVQMDKDGTFFYIDKNGDRVYLIYA